MKMVKTDFKKKVNEGSSWIVYITKSREDAQSIYNFAMTQRALLKGLPGSDEDLPGSDWYYSVGMADVQKDCRIPEFFHDKGYYATIIEHNNGNWDFEQKYELYIVE